MARDRLAAMRAQQAAGSGGYGGSETGAGNNGYGDHLYPTQQTAGVPYNASTGLPQVSDSVNATPVAVYSGHTSYGHGQHGVFQQPNMPASAQGALPQDTYEMQPHNTNVVTSADGLGPATYAGSPPGTQSATSYGAGAQGSTAINMPDGNSGSFFNEISSLQDAIRQIEQNINRISELHSRSLNNVGEASQMEAESQLTGLAQQTSSLTNGVKNRIKALEAEALSIPASGPAPEGIDRNVRLTQIGAAKNRFKETILRYQEVEKAYRTKYRQRTERQLRIVKPDATQDEIQGALDGSMGGQQIFAQALQNSNRQGEARGALREVQERHNDIQRIEQTIVELAALFQEMSILVEQQDEQLNVIKDYAQNTEQEVQAAYVLPLANTQTSTNRQGRCFRKEAPQNALDLFLDPCRVNLHNYRCGRRWRLWKRELLV
ncbi:hypothetical protein MPSI1_002052 [Malassezia psittaci]|uniref:t-SNARE coiled-coil homology domain-containing protein n=1 Tax=Malassezia psittaci TaxID=1821823 RepID=A0AAF0FBS8_9BASI|nr:hypothetical protein MPSI1_002052 [Malassezia psittaci]